MNGVVRSIWGVVPVKGFDTAKSRLAAVLSGSEREGLARRMFEHVVGLLTGTPSLAGVLVVTDSDRVAEAAAAIGAISVRDPAARGTLADVVDHALGKVRERGATAAVVMVSDLPAATRSDVDLLVEELARFDVVIARDGGREHTNALALHLGFPFETSFGADDSARRHRETAERAGLSVHVIDVSSLAFDVDTPDDYARLSKSP